MEDDMFIDVKSRLDEFANVLYIDYERESVLLEVRKDYLDEIIKILKNNWLAMDIIFQKEIQSDILTIIACVPHIIDVYDE
jgi:hypothetical protein